MLDNFVLKYKSNPRAQQMSKIGGVGLLVMFVLWLVMEAMSAKSMKPVTAGAEKVDTSLLDPRNQNDPFEKEGLVKKIDELTEQVKKGSTAYDVRISELQEGMKTLDKENTELRQEVNNAQRKAEDKFNDRFEILARQFQERLEDISADTESQKELSEQIMARLPTDPVSPAISRFTAKETATAPLPDVGDEYASLMKKYQKSKDEGGAGVKQSEGVAGIESQAGTGKGATQPSGASIPVQDGFSFAMVDSDGQPEKDAKVAPKGTESDETDRSAGVANGGKSRGQNGKGGDSVDDAGKQAKGSKEGPDVNAEKGIFIPAGSLLRGVLITGVDAPTGVKAESQPHPVLIRIKKEAILPSRYRANLRDCFVIGGATARLNTGRVYIRSERISCIRNDGGVIEAPLASYASGEDSKIGLSGRIVSKQGSLIARSIMAGFLAGVSDAFKPEEVPVLLDSTGDNTLYQSAKGSDIATVAAYNGISVAAEKVADYYLALADDVPPVVELNGGRNVELVLMQGVQLAVR